MSQEAQGRNIQRAILKVGKCKWAVNNFRSQIETLTVGLKTIITLATINMTKSQLMVRVCVYMYICDGAYKYTYNWCKYIMYTRNVINMFLTVWFTNKNTSYNSLR